MLSGRVIVRERSNHTVLRAKLVLGSAELETDFIISNVLGADTNRSKSRLQQTSHLHISPIENRTLGLDHAVGVLH